MERPILFSAPMVRAILDGTKTQTRRPVVAPWMQFVQFTGGKGDDQNDPRHWGFEDDDGEWWALEGHAVEGSRTLPCRIAQEGDRLWVRETWRPVMEGWQSYVEYKAGRPRLDRVSREQIATVRKFAMRFEGADAARNSEAWHPSIHMPKWAARIWLDVLSVRAERLQEISDADARAEGVEPRGGGTAAHHAAFRLLWCETYGHAAWDANPWVWVVTFKRGEGQP